METFDGFTGAKGLKVARPFGKGRLANTLDFAEAETLLAMLRDQGRGRPFNPERLGGIGPLDVFPPHYARVVGTFLRRASRGEQHATIPFVVEAWAESINGDRPDVRFSVNRTPITAAMQAYHNAKEKKLSLFGCGLNHCFPAGPRPLRLRVNVETPYMPIASDGKAPDLLPLKDEVFKVLQKVANAAKSQAIGVKKSTQEAVILEHLEAAIDKVSGGRTSRYSLRQLFYEVRPRLIEAIGGEPNFKTFSQIITRVENRRGGDLPGIYRDTRGVLYHPHTGEEIPLGTLNVERYRMPSWTFNKILYCEKEGFFPMLRDAAWPERQRLRPADVQGVRDAGGPGRDRHDGRVGGGPAVLLHPRCRCARHADPPGPRASDRRGGVPEGPDRQPRPGAVGSPGDGPGRGEGQPQGEEAGGGRRVRRGPGAEWVEWLQGYRVELNAMTTPQFIEWLDRKFEPHIGKVVPPQPVLAERLEGDAARP